MRVGAGLEQLLQLFSRWRVDLAPSCRWRRSAQYRVHVEPSPLDRLVERGRQDGVAFADAERSETGLGELAVEAVEVGGTHLVDRERSQMGFDVGADGRAIASHRPGRTPLGLDVGHPLVEQLGDGVPAGLGAVAPSLDLGDQGSGRPLRIPLRSVHPLGGVLVLARGRVTAERNPDLPVVVATGPDAPPHGKNATRFMAVLWSSLRRRDADETQKAPLTRNRFW